MPLPEEIETLRSSLADIGTLATAELLGFWRSLSMRDPSAAAGAIRDFLPENTATYRELAAELAAAFYETSREDAGAPGVFDADPVVDLDPEQVQSLVSFAATPLFYTRQEPELGGTGGLQTLATVTLAQPDTALALSRLIGGQQRLVMNGARETIETNAARDPGNPRYVRHARAGACAFCALLATRDEAYRSEQSAGRVVTGRGSRLLGERYHDFCNCVPIAVWPGETYERPAYVDEWERSYVKARQNGARSTSAVLAEMRATLSVA